GCRGKRFVAVGLGALPRCAIRYKVNGCAAVFAGARLMHVYFRWYANGQSQGTPQRMESENVARSAVLQRYPTATFSERIKTLHQPAASMLSGIDEMLYAWPGPRTPGVDPIADILFPAP